MSYSLPMQESPAAAPAPAPRGTEPRVIAGVALLVIALVGWVAGLARLDHGALHRTGTVAAGHATEGLEVLPVPAGGSLRVVLCSEGPAPAHARLTVRPTAEAPLAERSLEARPHESRKAHCVELAEERPSPAARLLALELRVDPAPRPLAYQVYASRPVRLVDALPVLALALGCALLLVFPSRRHTVSAPEPGETQAPRRPVVALLLYASTVPIIAVVQLALIAIAGRGASFHTTGLFFGLTILAQHAYMAVLAWWLLGKPRTREALGFAPLTAASVMRAVPCALVLIAVALLVTRLTPDLGATPMGQLLEKAPVRYAVGATALLAPFSEELFFRGAMVHAFGRRGHAWGVAAATVVFTLGHAMQLGGASLGLVPIAAVALMNGWLRVRSRALSEPWLVHLIYNGALSSVLYFSGT